MSKSSDTIDNVKAKIQGSAILQALSGQRLIGQRLIVLCEQHEEDSLAKEMCVQSMLITHAASWNEVKNRLA